jgi:glycosyltransferase involved in cell wall biosynthesis
MNYSILQTVYKSDDKNHLKTAIESMLTQSLPSDDYVIVEDGPLPVELEDLISSFVLLHPEIHIVKLPANVGLGKALNEGLPVCKNELIARMDSDDISMPERCEKQVRAFENDPELDIVGCPVKEFIGTPDNIVGQRDVPIDNESIHKYVRRRDPFNHPTVMYRKSKVMKYGPYGDYRKNQDTDLWIKLLSNGCKAINIDEYLLMFRFDEGTYRKRKGWTNTKCLIDIRWKAFKDKNCSLWDFIVVSGVQMAIYFMPSGLQRFIYQHILR